MNKVCHITSAHREEDVRIFVKECSSLAEYGFDTYLVERGDSYVKNGVHIIGMGKVPNSRVKRVLKYTGRFVNKALELDCDIYHLHDPELLLYANKIKKHGKKVIFDSHENTADVIVDREYLTLTLRKLISYLYRKFETRICKKIDAVITVTPSQTEYFKKINSNTTEINNFPIFSPSKIGRRKPSKKMVFAGGIYRHWNHHVIINALEKLNGWTYVLCGSGDEKYIAELQEMPGWSKVDYRGRLPHQTISEIMDEAFVGLAIPSPSRNTAWNYGTMGNTKIFEEMMAGLPVICTGFELWKDFIEKYKCGITINPHNTNELIDALIYIENHSNEAIQMGENGIIAVKDEFNWAVISKRLITLYESLLEIER